jgi:hypothetical protein
VIAIAHLGTRRRTDALFAVDEVLAAFFMFSLFEAASRSASLRVKNVVSVIVGQEKYFRFSSLIFRNV